MVVDLPPDLPARAEYVMLFDVSKPSWAKRFRVIRLTGRKDVDVIVESTVAHGRGSDHDRDGRADWFSNEPDSHATSLGKYQISEGYIGKHGLSYRLIGLSATNSNAARRAVVIHPADYVKQGSAGASHGCPALSPGVFAELSERGVFKAKTFLYIYDSAKGWNQFKGNRAAMSKHQQMEKPTCPFPSASGPAFWAPPPAFRPQMCEPCKNVGTTQSTSRARPTTRT